MTARKAGTRPIGSTTTSSVTSAEIRNSSGIPKSTVGRGTLIGAIGLPQAARSLHLTVYCRLTIKPQLGSVSGGDSRPALHPMNSPIVLMRVGGRPPVAAAICCSRRCRAVERGRARADLHADTAARTRSAAGDRKRRPTASRSPRSAATATTLSTVTAGRSLPPGISLSSGGLLSGTPTTATTTPSRITATDTGGGAGFRPYTFSIGTPGGITISPGSPLPDGTLGVAYSQTLTASGGSGAAMSFSVSARLAAGRPLVNSAAA